MSFSSDPIGTLRRLAREQGEVARFEWNDTPCYLLSNPRHIHCAFTHHDLHKRQGKGSASCLLGRGLMTSEGDFNRDQRKLLRPLFAAGEKARWQQIVREQVEEFVADWQDGQRIVSLHEFGRLTMAVACRVLLDQRLPEEQQIHDLLEEVLKNPLAAVRQPLDEMADRLLRKGRGPLVETLLSVPLDDELRRDEVITMLLGAHETTATVLSFCMRMLALYGSAASSRQVVGETMRLYPPGWLVARMADEDVELDELKLQGPCAVLMCAMVNHYREDLWETPHLFRPERFPDHPASGTFFPFGGGRRICIGESLAWVEAEEVVDYLRERWVLDPVERGPVRLLPLASLRPACGLPARLHKLSPARRATVSDKPA
jgi:cytochrome P450